MTTEGKLPVTSGASIDDFLVDKIRRACENQAYRIMKNRGIGEGFSSYVYEVCLPPSDSKVTEDCSLVVKVVNMAHLDPKKVQKELYIGTLAGLAGVGPRIHDIWICDRVGSHEKEIFFDEPISEDTPSVEPLSLDEESGKYKHYTPTWSNTTPYLFVVMDKVRDETLRSYLSKNRGGAPAALCKALDKTLSIMFDAGIVHKDLHGDNILVDEGVDGWKVKIIDYGVADLVTSPFSASDKRSWLGGLHKETSCKQFE